jgi:cellulose biosynthesis protein BcsQ
LRLRHVTSHGRAIHQIAGASETRAFHVGVYTFKGGVGKTKLSLLLACALAHRGHNTVLIDLNRAQNLVNLVGEEGLYVRNERGPESVISVFSRDEWNLKLNKWKVGEILDAEFFIYDCPQFFEKPAERDAIRHFELVLSPIQLTVDSIGVGHSVLRDTIAEIRAKNAGAPVEFILSDLRDDQLNGPILAYLRAARPLINGGLKAALLHPEKFLIPHSGDLERLGTDRALNPANAIALQFSTDLERRQKWTRQALQLADHVILASRR